MEYHVLWIVAVIGSGTLIGVFLKMKGGFGPLNLRAVGLVLIAMLAALLAVAKSDNLNAAMGILGAIAGYLFGAKADADASRAQMDQVLMLLEPDSGMTHAWPGETSTRRSSVCRAT